VIVRRRDLGFGLEWGRLTASTPILLHSFLKKILKKLSDYHSTDCITKKFSYYFTFSGRDAGLGAH
jgi:hypothetical protein